MIRCPKWSELFVFCSRLGVRWHTIALMCDDCGDVFGGTVGGGVFDSKVESAPDFCWGATRSVASSSVFSDCRGSTVGCWL